MDFDDLDVDDLNIDGQLFWAVNILIIYSWIMFDIKIECYEGLISLFYVEVLRKIKDV